MKSSVKGNLGSTVQGEDCAHQPSLGQQSWICHDPAPALLRNGPPSSSLPLLLLLPSSNPSFSHGLTLWQGLISEMPPHGLVQTLRVDDFMLDLSCLCTGNHSGSSHELPHHQLCCWSCISSDLLVQDTVLPCLARAATHAHIAISNCSIHFLFISSVLQKNWKPCFPWRWIR